MLIEGARIGREAGKLSGGEQQVLALATALVPKPRLIMLDERSLGLGPNLLDDLFEKIAEIQRETGMAVPRVEQKVRGILNVCQRGYLLRVGKVSFSGPTDELQRDEEALKGCFCEACHLGLRTRSSDSGYEVAIRFHTSQKPDQGARNLSGELRAKRGSKRSLAGEQTAVFGTSYHSLPGAKRAVRDVNGNSGSKKCLTD